MAKDLAVSALLDFYGPFLSEKQRNLLHHYYNEDLSLAEIAENEGITRQGVADFVKRSEAQLLDFEQKLNLCSKISRLKSVADAVREKGEEVNSLIEIIEQF